MKRYAEAVCRYAKDCHTQADPSAPGAGAAGGLGFATQAFLHGRMRSGAELLFDAWNMEKKMEEARKSEENRTGRVHFDADGILHVRNSTLNWIPEIAFEEEVRGTTYTVTGSYEGGEMLDAKVERLLAKGDV